MQDNEQILLEVRNKDLTWPEELGALVSGNTTVNTLISSERRPTITLPPGATGLQNLGNTCFMNAALQAVSNTRPLTLYFQRDLSELNSTNPLGTKGQVAKRYAELCRDLWAGSTRSVAPIRLRLCVTKHAPNLGGGGQHDSQELLAWLLDSLHEDLNRVPKKQFVELRDSDGRPDAVVADEAWNQHLARDHSIITDLFYGQLKSKVTCQTCGHESVKFDPFNLLSLPLPMESYTLCEILVIRLNGDVPIKYGLRLNSEAKYYELKQQLQNLCNIPPERLSLAEVASSQIKQFLGDDNKIISGSATELYAYELPKCNRQDSLKFEEETDLEQALVQTPLARSPEVRSSSALCMPNILCFKNLRSGNCDNVINQARLSTSGNVKKASIHSNTSATTVYTDNPTKTPTYLVAVHRKFVTQETYFLSQHKSMPSLFGVPLLLGCNYSSTCQSLYEVVQQQVTRLLSPQPQSDQTNHAQDCDDSLGYEFPFSLRAVMQNGERCARCHWTQFCPGCKIPCTEENLFDFCKGGQNVMCVAIDWDPTALHLRYQSSREKLFIEHESVGICRKLHTEPIDLDYCLRAFTSEERLETKYHCSKCQDKQPATKKLQIWRLPPILIIHLKRFDYVNNKWVKTQKVVNFPFKNFDPTAYLASVPQETILRHRQLLEKNKSDLDSSCETTTISADVTDRIVEENGDSNGVEVNGAQEKLLDVEDEQPKTSQTNQRPRPSGKRRERLESTSLIKTPIIDEDLRDFHEHKLLKGQDPFDLKYQLYAVVSHSGMLNGGHYISYACNPNGHWYCYNDSSCREVLTEDSAPILQPPPQENNNNDSRQTNNYNSPIINRIVNSPAHTPLMRRKHPRSDSSSTLSQMSSDTGSSTVCNTSDASMPNIASCKTRCSNTSLNATNDLSNLNDGTD
ncbi:Peptidase, partial [Oryctes borbonicus]